ncbi:MAG: hypothetical protein U5K75_03870 [Ahrensia sp.]|nr:hypothetical protein [Ahrensia sp.]
MPKVTGAVRHTKTDTSSSVTGAQADIAIPLGGGGFANTEVRVLGLAGNRDILGRASVSL